MSLMKLSQHFSNFWKRRGKDATMDVTTPNARARQAADDKPDVKTKVEEAVKPVPAAPAPATPPKPSLPVKPEVQTKPDSKPADKKPEPKVEDKGVDVVEKVKDLDENVAKAIERKVELALKRVIDESLRTYLDKPLAQLEKGIRPEVDKVIADQALDVRKEINQAVPAAKDVNPNETNKGPLEPIKEKPAVEASINKDVISELPNEIIVEDGVKLSADPNNKDMYQVVIVNADGTMQTLPFGIAVSFFRDVTPDQATTMAKGVIEESLKELEEKFGKQDVIGLPGKPVVPEPTQDAAPIAASDTRIQWFRKS